MLPLHWNALVLLPLLVQVLDKEAIERLLEHTSAPGIESHIFVSCLTLCTPLALLASTLVLLRIMNALLLAEYGDAAVAVTTWDF